MATNPIPYNTHPLIACPPIHARTPEPHPFSYIPIVLPSYFVLPGRLASAAQSARCTSSPQAHSMAHTHTSVSLGRPSGPHPPPPPSRSLLQFLHIPFPPTSWFLPLRRESPSRLECAPGTPEPLQKALHMRPQPQATSAITPGRTIRHRSVLLVSVSAFARGWYEGAANQGARGAAEQRGSAVARRPGTPLRQPGTATSLHTSEPVPHWPSSASHGIYVSA